MHDAHREVKADSFPAWIAAVSMPCIRCQVGQESSSGRLLTEQPSQSSWRLLAQHALAGLAVNLRGVRISEKILSHTVTTSA